MPSSLFKTPVNNNVMQVKSMMNMVQNSQNPQAVLSQLAMNNSNVAQVLNLIRQSGGDPKTAFYSLAKQKGIDPDQIIAMLR